MTVPHINNAASSESEILLALKSDAVLAADLFVSWAYDLLKCSAPRELVGCGDFREDITNEIILHCIRNNCRILHSYQNIGHSLAGWFYVIARRKTLELMKSPKYRSLGSALDYDQVSSQGQSKHPNEELRIVWELINQMDRKCRLLLKFAAEEHKPKEITVLLGISPAANAKISNRMQECRRKLQTLLKNKRLESSKYFRGQ